MLDKHWICTSVRIHTSNPSIYFFFSSSHVHFVNSEYYTIYASVECVCMCVCVFDFQSNFSYKCPHKWYGCFFSLCFFFCFILYSPFLFLFLLFKVRANKSSGNIIPFRARFHRFNDWNITLCSHPYNESHLVHKTKLAQKY